jgi:zinc protease
MKKLAIILLTFIIFFNFSCAKKEPFKIMEVKKSGVPVVYLACIIKAGSAFDPQGKEGLSNFTSQLLRRGTKSFTREQIDNTLDLISGEINIRVNRELIVITGRTMKENLEKFYPIFYEVILAPTFPSEEVEKMKIDQKSAIDGLIQDDAELVKEGFIQYIFQNHPYGHSPVGKYSTIETFSQENAKNFYEKYFVKNNIILGLAGDYDNSLKDKFKKDFAGLKVGELAQIERKFNPVTGRKIFLIEKEGRDQTQIRFGFPYELKRGDKEYFPILVANTYFGKHREQFGVLFRIVRSARGLSYGAYSYFEEFEQFWWTNLALPNNPLINQYFSCWTYPKRINAKFTLKLVLKLLTDLVNNGIPEEGLKQAKDFEKNHFPFEIETPDRTLGMKLDEEFYASKDFLKNFEKDVESVTKQDVDLALKKLVSPENIVISAIVSNGEEFKSEVLSNKTEMEYPSGAEGSSLQKEDSEVMGFDLKLKPEDFTIIKVAELFK